MMRRYCIGFFASVVLLFSAVEAGAQLAPENNQTLIRIGLDRELL